MAKDLVLESYKVELDHISFLENDRSTTNEEKIVMLLAHVARGIAGLDFNLKMIDEKIEEGLNNLS